MDGSCLGHSEIELGLEPRGTETELGSPREPPRRPAMLPPLSEAPPVLTALTASGYSTDSASLVLNGLCISVLLFKFIVVTVSVRQKHLC